MAPDATLDYLGPPRSCDAVLGALTTPVRGWFREQFGTPTPAQRLAWPILGVGKHLLLSAPTGTGKTLAAFVPILDVLLRQPCAGGTRCLYVAPLKALVNDARKNLRRAIRGMAVWSVRSANRAASRSEAITLRIGVRTGDTAARVRRALSLAPPDILLTTPESLAVLLSQQAFCDSLHAVHWIVIDEIHALAGNKRGADLSLGLERIVAAAADEPQRIGLSATCAPLGETARFLAGTDRPCTVAAINDATPLDLRIEPVPDDGGFFQRLVEQVAPELEANRSTLIFTNTRGLAERLAWTLRRHFPQWDDAIACHHSSLAFGRRRRVERLFKQGHLRAVISSTSLELGIDIGSVDGVVLVHPPGGVVRLLQRVGRSGHGPGRRRRGLVLTASPAELLEAAVTGAGSRDGQAEPLQIPEHPLDVLCQHLAGMACQRSWLKDEALAVVRRAYPYGRLPLSEFNACLDYLSGRRSNSESWLPARLRWDGDEFRIVDSRTGKLLRRNLGTIVADEPRLVRIRDGFPVGELDDAYADRLQPGDRFLLDGRCLELRQNDGPDLFVDEVPGRPAVPRWGKDGPPLAPALAERLYLFRIRAAEALREGPSRLADLLRHEYGLTGNALDQLADYVERQESVSEIPDARALLIEAVQSAHGVDYYVHTPLNRAGNDALARVAMRRLRHDRGVGGTSVVADLGFALLFRRAVTLGADDWRNLFASDDFENDLNAAVDDSITLRERFRRVAQTGLMVLRNPLGGRRRVGGPDWAERRLFDQVRAAEPDFVLLRQALREVREVCCAGNSAERFLQDIPCRDVKVRVLATVSPFVDSWTQLAAGPAEHALNAMEALRRLQPALGVAG
jgi:ATP-dependent Lhr-like helicase